MKESYLDGPLQTVEYEGKTWGVPWFTDAGMYFCRRDLLQRAGFSEPPATWDEMKERARKVKADLGARNGCVFQGSQARAASWTPSSTYGTPAATSSTGTGP
jgi:multiple sugar transport system substrate-binding protein